jgi:hypothetical protein
LQLLSKDYTCRETQIVWLNSTKVEDRPPKGKEKELLISEENKDKLIVFEEFINYHF